MAGKIIVGGYNNAFCGVGAVIVFFVVSGFCIHYPFVLARTLPIGPFYVRRYIRIVGPLVIALTVGGIIGQSITVFYQAIIWSLVAELIYYTLYPAIRPIFEKWPLQTVVASYIPAVALVVTTHPGALNFHEFGPWLTWIVGLPSWLLGCLLAIYVSSAARVRVAPPWNFRVAVWILSSVASIVRFHLHIGYPWTLTPFAVVVFFWIREEIAYYRVARPSGFFEYCGKFSYSIYLVHGLGACPRKVVQG